MLHVNEYIPLVSCGVGEGMVVVCGQVRCTVVLLLLKVTLTFVFLKRLVIFLTCGEECVKMSHFVFCVGVVGRCGWSSFFCMLCLNFVRRWMGMLLYAVCLMFLHKEWRNIEQTAHNSNIKYKKYQQVHSMESKNI